jgi:hypothetical protein
MTSLSVRHTIFSLAGPKLHSLIFIEAIGHVIDKSMVDPHRTHAVEDNMCHFKTGTGSAFHIVKSIVTDDFKFPSNTSFPGRVERVRTMGSRYW